MAAVIANLAAGVSGAWRARSAGRHRHGPDAAVDRGRTSDRGLGGGFNSKIVRAAREHIRRLIAEGKNVRILAVGRKADDQLRRDYRPACSGSRPGGRPAPASPTPPVIGRSAAVSDGEADVVSLFFSRFRSVIFQTPTRAS